MRQLDEIQADINTMDTAIQNAGTGVDVSSWQAEKDKYEKEYSEAKTYWDAQEQQKAQAEQIGGLKETIRTIFEAAFPKDETVKIIGLTEYETTQQTFNQLIDQAVDEDQTALYGAFKEQLEQRDEKVRDLTVQALETQKQLDEEKTKLQECEAFGNQQVLENESLKEENNKLTEENKSLQQIVDNHDEQLSQRDEEIQRLKDREFNLQKEIAGQSKPSQVIDITPTAPSESLSERIAQTKIASQKQLAEIRPFGNNFSDIHYTDGTKEIVHNSMIPSLEQPIAPLETPNIEQVATFPEVQAADNTGVQTDQGNESIHEVVEQSTKAAEETPVTRAEHDALAARVARIEAHANLPIAV